MFMFIVVIMFLCQKVKEVALRFYGEWLMKYMQTTQEQNESYV